MITYNEIMEILDKREFFNQRAARELWSEKPFEIQELDIESFHLDMQKIKEYIEQYAKGDNRA